MVQKIFRRKLSGIFSQIFRESYWSRPNRINWSNFQGDEYDGAQARAQVGAPSKVGAKPAGVSAPKTTTRKSTTTKPSTTTSTRPSASRTTAPSGGSGDSSQYKRQVEELNEKLITMEQSLESLERVSHAVESGRSTFRSIYFPHFGPPTFYRLEISLKSFEKMIGILIYLFRNEIFISKNWEISNLW